ncbi:MAG: hypothetical protein H7X95_00920, partial [Deltaproteobacteria bacterium]|nr:hypothetical protein [Deltaproteobacteria bacterium]
ALWAYLDQSGGDERADVVNAAVFTTQRATGIVALLRQKIWSLGQPTIANVLLRRTTTTAYKLYDGEFQSPNFQVGDPPYSATGGQMDIGADDLPVVQRMENLRVSFCIPARVMPVEGFPVTIFATGAGGDYHSFSDYGVARILAAGGIASISIDQVLSGPRNPKGPPGDIAFYNFSNPQAARYNALQGAADNFSLLRLLMGLSHTEAPLGAVPERTIKFDPARIYFFGHSQGGITGAPFLALEPNVKAAVLSGTSALLYQALLHKTDPIDISAIVKLYIPDQPLDVFNPILALIQTWIERSESANYAPLFARKPATGSDGMPLAPKDVYQSEGFDDRAAPNVSIQAFATAVGGNQVSGIDGGVRQIIDGLTLRGRETLIPPVTGNLAGRTVVLVQYDELAFIDGHFIALFGPAQFQWLDFLVSKARTGAATLPVPR